MADQKITGLTNFDSSNTPYWPPAPASDVIPIVDISDNTMAASGTTKKISINNLLSSSPTASGNFTITGDLTVDTSTLKVDSANNRVGIGTASPGTTLDVVGANKTNANEYGITNVLSSDSYAIDKGGSVGFWGKYNAGGGNACFARIYGAKENATDGSFTGYFAVSTSPGGTPVERLRLDSSGNLSLASGNLVMSTSGKGIDFSATPNSSGTMTSELLNDYEEGTFTPTIIGGVTGSTFTAQDGFYTKVGRLVTIYLRISTSASTRAAAIFQIGSLPFNVVTPGAISFAYTNSGFFATAGASKPNAFAFSNYIVFYKADGSAFNGTDIAADAFDIRLSVSYYV